MTQELWTDVDEYFSVLIPRDEALEAALRDADAAGLPAYEVSPNQGKMLGLTAKMMHAKRVLEIGTLAGYSSIWLGRAVGTGGRVVTLELNPMFAEVAARNIERADLQDIVEIRVGNAVDSLAGLFEEHVPPFDLVFIDADKPNNPTYLQWALQLTHPGSVIIADNVVRGGQVIDAEETDARVQGIRQFTDMVARDPRLEATVLQTVGSKGHDGYMLIYVLGMPEVAHSTPEITGPSGAS